MDKELFARNQVVANLMKIGHGDLSLYVPEGIKAARYDPLFWAHLIAWNFGKSEVRDSKVALPVIGLRGLTREDVELAENAIGHLVMLSPRELERAYQFSKQLTAQGLNITGGYRSLLQSSIQRYLKTREDNTYQWDRAVLSNRKAMIALYTESHTKPSARAQHILFDRNYPANSVFAAVAGLKNMTPQEAAGTILNHRIPFPIAIGAGVNVKDEVVALALVDAMTGAELLNNTKMLRDNGLLDIPVVRAAYDEGLKKVETDKRVSSLKATRAAEALGEETEAAKKLYKVQEKKLEQLGGIEGDWLVLGDQSGSMSESLEVAKQVAALLAQQVKGHVYLVWFNVVPHMQDVTGKTLEDIRKESKYIRAGGGTSIGCGLELLRQKGIVVNGIAIVSDGADNTYPLYHTAYQSYAKDIGIQPTSYLFRVPGEPCIVHKNCQAVDIPMEVYGLEGGVDYYSLPNIVKSLKTGRYGLLDDIMQTPLITLDEAFA